MDGHRPPPPSSNFNIGMRFDYFQTMKQITESKKICNYVVCKCYDTVYLNKEKETIPTTDNMPDNLVMARVARQDIQNRINHIKNNTIQVFNIKHNGSEAQIFYNCFHVVSFLKIKIYKSSPEINVKSKANITFKKIQTFHF